jgi:hypothetical protein
MMQNDIDLCKTQTRQWAQQAGDGRKAQPPVLRGSSSTMLPGSLPAFPA